MRTAAIQRVTRETDVKIELDLNGTGEANIDSGVGFFNHMLELLTVHGKLDLTLVCKGDVEVDFHHSVEDVGIALGDAVKQGARR